MPRPPACGYLKTRVGKTCRQQLQAQDQATPQAGNKGNNSSRRNSRHQIFSENSKLKIPKKRFQKEQRQKRNETEQKMVEMGPDTGPDH